MAYAQARSYTPDRRGRCPLRNYHYSYLAGVVIFGAAWVVCSLLGKKHRAEIRWGSLISAPMALTSLLFVPQYWTPPSLFDLDQKIRVVIEDVLWAAAVGGIASGTGQILSRKKPANMRVLPRAPPLPPFLFGVLAVLSPVPSRPAHTAYNTLYAS